MRSLLNRRPSAATVISCTALFVALGGTSYAAVTIDGKTLKNRSVTAQKVKTRTLTGTQIKNNALTGKQIRESSLGIVPQSQAARTATTAERAQRADRAGSADAATTAKAAETAQTAQAAQTATTAQTAETAQNATQLGGKPAAAYASSAARVAVGISPTVTGTASGAVATVTVSCNTGERAISGGGAWYQTPIATATTDRVTTPMSRPVVTGAEITGWQVSGRNSASGVNKVLRGYVVCTPKS